MKILVALSRFPWPIDKGDKLRAYYQIRGLSKTHDIHLVCLSDKAVGKEEMAHMRQFCKSVKVISLSRPKRALNMLRGLLSKLPYQVHYFRSGRMKKEIQETIRAKKIDLCYVQLIRLGLNVPFGEKCSYFLDYMDAFSIGMKNRVELSGTFMRSFVRSEAKRLAWYEPRISSQFDRMSIISEQDAAIFDPVLRNYMTIVPNGVGESFLELWKGDETKRFDVVFHGNMGYHPTVQAARFLIEKVKPLLDAKGMKLRYCLAGASPAPAVKALAGENVTVTGFVEDIREYLHGSKVAASPLFSGQGLQNKLLEAMACGLPAVTAPLPHAALGAEAGKEIMVCEDAEQFARAIEKLINEPDLAAQMGNAGREFVRARYSWEAANAILAQAFEQARA